MLVWTYMPSPKISEEMCALARNVEKSSYLLIRSDRSGRGTFTLWVRKTAHGIGLGPMV